MTQTLRYKDITKEESAAKKVIVRMINLFVAKKKHKELFDDEVASTEEF